MSDKIEIYPHIQLCSVCGEPFIVDEDGRHVCMNDECEVWGARQVNPPYMGAWKVEAEKEE